MNKKEWPYIVECSFCGNGLLRPTRCGTCHQTVAICDECELIWTSIEGVFADPKVKSDGCIPRVSTLRKE